MSEQEGFGTIPRRIGREFFGRLGRSAGDVFDVPNDYREVRRLSASRTAILFPEAI